MRNSKLGDSLRKGGNSIIYPQKPFKRKLTNTENKAMLLHFSNHSWSDVDANGIIVLGNGMDDCGYYFITESDLQKIISNEIS